MRIRSLIYIVGYGLSILLALLVINLINLRFYGAERRLDMGSWGEHELVQGLWARETDEETEQNFRWTSARSRILLHSFAVVADPFVTLHIGTGLPPGVKPPVVVHARIDSGPALPLVVTGHARQYHLLPPASTLRDGDLEVSLASDVVKVPDGREIGVRVDAISVEWPREYVAFPAWELVAVQLAITALGIVVGMQLGLPRRTRWLIAAGLILFLGFITGRYLFVAMVWQVRLLWSSLVLLGVALGAVRLLRKLQPALGTPRQLRWLVFLAVLVTAIRLFGALYPGFESHDQFVHWKRLTSVQLGTTYITGHPYEFGNRATIIPPAPYVAMLPVTLLIPNKMIAIQTVYAIVDGLGVLILAAFVRRIGGSFRAALLSAIAITALPNMLTILWWGFAPQIIGQWLFVLLAVFALQAQGLAKRGWVGVFIVCSIALITHPGVTSLGAIWLGGYVALLWLFRRREPTLWRRWVLILVASGALAFALTYLDMAQLYQTDDRGVGIPVSVGIDPFRSQQLVKGLSAAMRPIGYVLAGVSLGVLLWKTSGTRRYLVLAWCAASALFLVVDLLLGMQVRYSYFATPMVCAGLGLLLDDLITRSWWGRVISWGLLALICINGLIVWYSGVIWRVKPTLMGLSHG